MLALQLCCCNSIWCLLYTPAYAGEVFTRYDRRNTRWDNVTNSQKITLTRFSTNKLVILKGANHRLLCGLRLDKTETSVTREETHFCGITPLKWSTLPPSIKTPTECMSTPAKADPEHALFSSLTSETQRLLTHSGQYVGVCVCSRNTQPNASCSSSHSLDDTATIPHLIHR